MAEREVLKNKPLVEAIFEVRWRLKEVQPGIAVDEDFPLVPGLLYERLRGTYPDHTALPIAELPPELGAQVPRFQFRTAGGSWPLVQVGPGIVTLNDTENYRWEDFVSRIGELVEQLFDVYTTIGKRLEVERLTLRYVDAIEFDYLHEDIVSYLNDKLKIQVGITPAVFEKTTITPTPSRLALEMSFASENPPGSITISLATGKRELPDKTPRPALIWHSHLTSDHRVAVEGKADIMEWVESGHDLINGWFFTLIEGDLLEQFRG